MNKNLLYKVFSMALAFLVLLSTFSFKVETHSCGSNIVDVAVFSKVKSCCASAVKIDSELQFVKKSCCSNKVILVDGLNQFKVVPFTADISVEKVFVASSTFNCEALQRIVSVAEYHPGYSPPDLIVDHQIEHQVFLI